MADKIKHSPRTRSIFFPALITIGLLVLFDIPRHIGSWLQPSGSKHNGGISKLIPQTRRIVGVRFDPSYHYTGVRPQVLARQLAEKWHASGVNLVFYRSYDPKYGAFYRTDYKHNEMDEFGKYDLLQYVLKECHKLDIQVFGWLHVLNHRGAWRENEAWRARRADGSDYQATGLEFPLCARNPHAARWYEGFVEDLISRHPEIDGIDLAEPVVSWKSDDACRCRLCMKARTEQYPHESMDAIRAGPLSDIVAGAVRVIRRAGKRASVTLLQPAKDDGRLMTPAECRALTGFDLSAVIHAEEASAPDYVCPEFLWQEQRSSRQANAKAASYFTPEWTEQAVRNFRAWIDTPVGIITHLEITDFPGTTVGKDELASAARAAIRGGATGLDIYSSSELDRKNAWSAVKNASLISPQRRCLVLHDPNEGLSDAVQICELLRHFNVKADVRPMARYGDGDLFEFDNVFYVGSVSGSPIPAAFLKDIGNKNASTLTWIGANIEVALCDKAISSHVGLEYIGNNEGDFKTVRYKGVDLRKEEPWTTIVRPFPGNSCRVLATASNGERTVPYALRSGQRFWYFADVPPSSAVEGGRYLVFADLLHDILEENHTERRQAMVRIEDVHPWTDPGSLRRMADFLYSENVPFQVATVPFYVHPEDNAKTSIGEQPAFSSALRYMAEKGGAILMHGVTHQRYGETTADYEFWDPLADCAPGGESHESVKAKLERGLAEFWNAGVYPLAWETPHYAGSQIFYSTVARHFNIAMERRQSVDLTGSDQYFPYLIKSDRFGQIIVPENLGYIPQDNPNPALVLEPAGKMKVVRDGVASFFIHPFLDPAILEDIVEGLKRDGYDFVGLEGLPIKIEASNGVLTDCLDKIELHTTLTAGEERVLRFPGVEVEHSRIAPDMQGVFRQSKDIESGRLYAAHFNSLGRADEGAEHDGEFALRSLNFNGETCDAPYPLLLTAGNASGPFSPEAGALREAFQLIGVPPWTMGVDSFREWPDKVNLLIVTSKAASELGREQIESILESLNSGRISLILSGFSSLSDSLGIEKTETILDISESRDIYFPENSFRWARAVQTPAFEAPSRAAYIYIDPFTEKPLVVESSFGKGRYIHIGTAFSGNGDPGERYPYFLTHVLRQLNLFPALRGSGLDVYFNPGERDEDISVEDLVRHWCRSGVQTVYVAAWHVFPSWTYDYGRLIKLAHSNGMLVYAWFEPPHINEKFWLNHPECREINAGGEEAHADWRLLTAFGDPICREAALGEMNLLLGSYNWDGVMLNRVGFEGENDTGDTVSFTPFSPSVRETFRRGHDIAPGNPASDNLFLQFRAELAREALNDTIDSIRGQIGESAEIIITHDARRTNTGISVEDLLDLKKRHHCTLQIAGRLSGHWDLPEAPFDMAQLWIAPNETGEGFDAGATTTYPTGLSFYARIARFIETGRRFSLMSESSLYEVDAYMLPFVWVADARCSWSDEGLDITTSSSLDLVLSTDSNRRITVDGKTSGAQSKNRLIVPAGRHRIAVGDRITETDRVLYAPARLVDCCGDLIDAQIGLRGIKVDYRSDRTCVLVVSDKPEKILLGGMAIEPQLEFGIRGWAFRLPSGKGHVEIITRGLMETTVAWTSFGMANLILLASVASVLGIVMLLLIVLLRKTTKT